MMIHNTAILLCGLVLLPAAWGQAPKLAGQKAAPPQTGISKKPGNDGMQPDVRSLKDLLSKTGRVEYSSRFLPGSNNAPRQQWQQITDVSIDAPGCLVRVLLDESYGGGAPKSEAKTYFFETFDEVEALTEQEASDREDKRLGLAPAWTISGSVYDLVINGNRSDLRFADGAQASRAAETLRRLARPCHRPLDTRPEGGAPKLAETLQYIVDKLNAQGQVSSQIIPKSPAGIPMGNVIPMRSRVSDASADTATCQVRLVQDKSVNGRVTLSRNIVLSFRRVENVEVVTEQESFDRLASMNDPTGSHGLKLTLDPTTYILYLTFSGGGLEGFSFSDEATGNEVAKSVQHAAELCGSAGGSVSLSLHHEEKVEPQLKEHPEYAGVLTAMRQRAEGGDPESQLLLSAAYEDEEERLVKKDDTQAVYWIQRAAQQGLPRAQLYLAISYFTGKGVTKDNMQALKWLTLARLTCTGKDKEQADGLVEQFVFQATSGQIDEAIRLAKAWQPKRESRP